MGHSIYCHQGLSSFFFFRKKGALVFNIDRDTQKHFKLSTIRPASNKRKIIVDVWLFFRLSIHQRIILPLIWKAKDKTENFGRILLHIFMSTTQVSHVDYRLLKMILNLTTINSSSIPLNIICIQAVLETTNKKARVPWKCAAIVTTAFAKNIPET